MGHLHLTATVPKADFALQSEDLGSKSTGPRYAFSMGTFVCKVSKILDENSNETLTSDIYVKGAKEIIKA